ncbi:hypothetical protein WCLP8_4440002 [uncultured Gammaproteobacteria bacterium]
MSSPNLHHGLPRHSPGHHSPPHLGTATLPPPDTKRWVMRRKAEVVAGVRTGVISLEEACRRYTLSVEEFLSWQRLIESHGVCGLRATRLQDYRPGPLPLPRQIPSRERTTD